jgi:parvulin-like peptidyl-prolyl isomerase
MRRLLLSLVALALAASGCSAFGTAPAATVGGVEISRSSLDDEIEAILSNDLYRQALEQEYGAPAEGEAGKGTFSTAFVAQILSLRVYYEAIEQALEDDGAEISGDELEEAELAARERFEQLGPDVFDEFPKAYRDRLARQQAIIAVAQQQVLDEIGDDPEAYFEENRDEFARICISHALVGLQGGRSPEEAEARAEELLEEIESGETDFETVAREQSDDTAAAQEGGDLGCGTQLDLPFDATFEAAAFALEEGVVSEPVLTQFGAHLILVTDRSLPDYEEVADIVPSVMQQSTETRFFEFLNEVICGGDVDVNPRYGTWNDDACGAPAVTQLPGIDPPEGPQREEEEPPGFEIGG